MKSIESECGDMMNYMTKNAKPCAAIVIGPGSSEFDRWVADEFQRHFRMLSGAELPIVQAGNVPDGMSLVALGGPKSNPLAASAEKQGLVSYAGLKQDGFIIRTTVTEQKPVMFVGGNSEASTMYAVYELLERLGIVFQISNDVIPERKNDIAMPQLDISMTPAFDNRGVCCVHGVEWYMGMKEFKEKIDQLAKLKANVLFFYWGMGGPWVEFSYNGKKAQIIYPPESGYCSWKYTGGTANDVKVGRSCFPADGYVGPAEFASVRTEDEAFATAREFLREVIRYAHSRKVQVWLCLGDIPYVPSNMVPETSEVLNRYWCGSAISYGDPALIDIWESAAASVIETYPEADRYWFGTGAEIHIKTSDQQTQMLNRDYERVRSLLPAKWPLDLDAEQVAPIAAGGTGGLLHAEPKSKEALDGEVAAVAVADKLLRRIKARFPSANLGASLIFRGGQMRALDAVLPKDVMLMNLVNWHPESHMDFYAGIQGRGLGVMPRITDDQCEMHIQLNTKMYDHDRNIADGVKHGLTSIIGQLNKTRGAEISTRYILEGAWNPDIRPESFYRRYLKDLFGADALELLFRAFMRLEENERALGWHGKTVVFSIFYGWTGSHVIKLRRIKYDQERLSLAMDEEELKSGLGMRGEVSESLSSEQVEALTRKFGGSGLYRPGFFNLHGGTFRKISTRKELREFYKARGESYRDVLGLLNEARDKVLPGSQAELDYVIFKTENFTQVLEMLSVCQDVVIEYDQALALLASDRQAEGVGMLLQSRDSLDRASRLARKALSEMITYSDDPTERYHLYLANRILASFDVERGYLTEVIDARVKILAYDNRIPVFRN